MWVLHKEYTFTCSYCGNKYARVYYYYNTDVDNASLVSYRCLRCDSKRINEYNYHCLVKNNRRVATLIHERNYGVRVTYLGSAYKMYNVGKKTYYGIHYKYKVDLTWYEYRQCDRAQLGFCNYKGYRDEWKYSYIYETRDATQYSYARGTK